MQRKREDHERQNLTVQLRRDTIRRAKLLAAQQGTSVSKLVADTIERLVAEEERYDAARRLALELVERGFHLGGRRPARRHELHER